MSSTFVKFNDATIKHTFGRKENIPVYLQFVPGVVVDVVTSTNSRSFSGPRDISSILAKSHVTDNNQLINTAGKTKRYFQLLRGIQDTPAPGDPVLLCTIGGTNYFLGPLNTTGSPNWNIDHLNKSDVKLSHKKSPASSELDVLNVSDNFQAIPVARLQKQYNPKLDDPQGSKPNKRDIHGDLMFEGRHGNSIRIGSREAQPYIYFSNGRGAMNVSEGTTDGSLIGMFNYGTIRNHFPGDAKAEGKEVVEDPFQLGADLPKGAQKSLVGSDYDYEYDKPQILQTSDRITLSSRIDSLFLSSYKDIFAAAGTNIKIASNTEILLDSKNIYVGPKGEPLVGGDTLESILKEIVGIIEGLKQTGIPYVSISSGIDGGSAGKCSSVKKKLKNFKSKKHYVEL